MTNQEQFFSILENAAKGSNREQGVKNILAWLETTDFFEAPASTKYHLAEKGGLCRHSLNVYNRLVERSKTMPIGNSLTIAICGLLHDLCKANYYKVAYRNVKNEQTGQWEKTPFYTVEDSFPMGHGEKSVYLIERFIRLTPIEAMAIRWHMGGFDSSAKGGEYAISNAFSNYPLAVCLHIADLEATYFDERNDKNEN